MAVQATKPDTKNGNTTPAEDRTAEICLTAAQVICEKGYDATSMNDIAAAVKLTKAGLYYYTSGKQDLLYRIIDYAMGLIEEISHECEQINDPEERLKQIIHRHVITTVDGGGSITILANEMNALSPEQREEIRVRKRSFLALTRETLFELQEAGRLNDLIPEIAALNIFATIHGIPRWYNSDGDMPSTDIADQISRFLLNALLKC
ncbi:MAG: TetR family transcriptional regulator [Planctomycetaceae bacterium]|nr:TetR family transcriptional regulator [Planctomycetaceae bacterium]